jgi:peptidylprolyl isomerase domain and WD repeat-containing protein 1
LWKKQESGIEFVKHYRTSLKAIVAVAASEAGTLFATCSEGGEGRVFDVINFGASTLYLRHTQVILGCMLNLQT